MMMKSFGAKLLAAAAILFLNGCGNDYHNTAPHSIEKQECNRPFKCSYDVRLENKPSVQDLSIIANKIKDEAPAVDIIFINYYLPCMVIGNGAWASAKFSPELTVSIQDFVLEANPTCDKPNE